jgi:hypothetical protein
VAQHVRVDAAFRPMAAQRSAAYHFAQLG